MTERITRHREAADITHIGSQCELSLKIPGQYYASWSSNKKLKKMDFKTTYSFKDFWFSIISLEAEAFFKYLSSGEEFVLCTSDAGK